MNPDEPTCDEDLGTLSDAELAIAQRLDAGSDANVFFDFIDTAFTPNDAHNNITFS